MGRTEQRPVRTPWLTYRRPRGVATVALYCFPHAGGGTGEYVRWLDGLPGVWACGVQPPGRGSRLFEPAFTRMTELVDAIVSAVTFTAPFVLFGHSLGGLVAFEVTRALRERGEPQPQRLIVSGCGDPLTAARGPALCSLGDAELLSQIERLGGPLPAELRADPELLAITLAGLRADLEVIETYSYRPERPLECPVTVVVGADDGRAARAAEWRDHTAGRIDLHVLPGGHFYFRERQSDVKRIIHDSIIREPQ